MLLHWFPDAIKDVNYTKSYENNRKLDGFSILFSPDPNVKIIIINNLLKASKYNSTKLVKANYKENTTTKYL